MICSFFKEEVIWCSTCFSPLVVSTVSCRSLCVCLMSFFSPFNVILVFIWCQFSLSSITTFTNKSHVWTSRQFGTKTSLFCVSVVSPLLICYLFILSLRGRPICFYRFFLTDNLKLPIFALTDTIYGNYLNQLKYRYDLWLILLS